jgi:hypothetical protein
MYKADQTSALYTGFPNETDTGFVGFLQPKYLNGTWYEIEGYNPT